ncbi:FecR domain-containing protein [Leptospira sp. 96542]|nr:FecR domain-containing protein [Leptospira sp. 96542]
MLRFLLAFFFLLVQTSVFAEDLGIVSFVQGENLVSGPRFPKKPELLKLGSVLKRGDTVISKDGVCEIQLATQATVRTEKFSEILLSEILEPKTNTSTLRIMSGKLFVQAHKQKDNSNQLKIITPSYVAGVRGTEFFVTTTSESEGDNTLAEGVFVNEGIVSVHSNGAPETSGSLVKSNEEIIVFGTDLKKQILNEFAKEKMKIFKDFKKIKEENYVRIKEQIEKNEQLMEEIKGRLEE